MSKLEQNTTSLDEVLAMVNALPDAGSGGGGVETCTVVIKGQRTLFGLSYETLENGTVVYHTERPATTTSDDYTIENVVCGSRVLLINSYSYEASMTTENAETLAFYNNGSLIFAYAFVAEIRASSTPGATSTITIVDED